MEYRDARTFYLCDQREGEFEAPCGHEEGCATLVVQDAGWYDNKVCWTDADEAEFQSLLSRRREVVAKLVESWTTDEIDQMSYALAEDYDQQNAWDAYVKWTSPFEVNDDLEQWRDS